MNFFGCVNFFGLSVVLFVMGTIGAMEIVPARRCEILSAEVVKKFSSDTFAQASVRHQAQIMPKNISFKKNCYKPTLIFDIATRLPFDVQKIIVTTLFAVEGIAADKVEMFLNMPIAQALEHYAYTKEVKAGKAGLLLKKAIDIAIFQKTRNIFFADVPSVDKIFVDYGTVFEFAKYIESVDGLLQRNKSFTKVSREELQALAKVIEKDPFLIKDGWQSNVPSCNAYKKLTLARFKKHFANIARQTGLSFGVAMIPLTLAVMSRIIELTQSDNDYFKIYLPYFGLFPYFLTFNSDGIDSMPLSRDDKKLLVVGTFGGLISILAMAFVIPREYIIGVSGAMLGLYAAVCSTIGIINARAIKRYKVPFSTISKFLKRDLVILEQDLGGD